MNAEQAAVSLWGDKFKRTNGGFIGCCPVHNDNNPSFSIKDSDDGKLLYHCHAGCAQNEVTAELKQRGILSSKGGAYTSPKSTATLQPSQSLTVEVLAGSKKIPVDFLINHCRLKDFTYLNCPAVRIPYFNEDGEEEAVRFRTALTGKPRFKWRTGAKPILYGLQFKKQLKKTVVLVEGETDCYTLWFHKIPALGIPGASNWKDSRDAHHLDRIEKIYVIKEPDQGGDALIKKLSISSIRDRLYIIELDNHKDPSELYLSDPKNFKVNWQQATNKAVSWQEVEDKEKNESRAKAWEKCQSIAREKNILSIFKRQIRFCGVVGESRIAQLIFLLLISRLLNKPVSGKIGGPSSCGKSFVLDNVLKFFPTSSYYALTAFSEKSLVYSEEPLKHRFLIIYEAAGMNNDLASYLIRSLLSEDRLVYETVEKTKDGFKPRRIEREGPTGLLVTTTSLSLHPENETRLFTLPVTDTQEQTKDILLSMAGDAPEDIDLSGWVALQEWLETGETRVVIPFDKTLAENIPPIAVRLRRDFKAILNLIKSHAILHQANRDRDSQGRITATIEDYVAIRKLVADLVSEGVEATVKTTVRETVGAVAKLLTMVGKDTTIKVIEVAQQLNIDKSAASRRCREAISLGYLVNHEEKRGKPFKLTVGNVLPEEKELLPHPEKLINGTTIAGGGDACCTVDREGKGIYIPPPHREKTTFVEGAI